MHQHNITFQDLSKSLNLNSIRSIEVNHSRRMISVVCDEDFDLSLEQLPGQHVQMAPDNTSCR